ncbi:EamA family transporter [Moraxella caviae]|uniref:Carboxylate/amino acid/amine transporter n=1 Tax=Moraxella caviae TaxID=34060 RepID=A0A1T0A3A6_9GAMM|nr:DMT family transporter [Moraxella caviae]OOR90078.1 EamA family transporter [Moraxella caviae]STZ14694.1 carboxylate/amino acid/amine transporter [Moraxella caviae]VEW12886.1 carboxylate/amino acid/amine transporter [Moraxella caviae]
MKFFHRLPATTQGYPLIVFTMCVWGSFSLLSRLNVRWQIAAWDVIAMRFAIAALVLLPVLCYQKQWRFLFSYKAVVLALVGGVGYSCLVYSAFLLAPVVHGAVFLNGMIPVATALLSALFFRQKPDTNTKIALYIIIATLIAMLMMIAFGAGGSFGLGDAIFAFSAFCWAAFGLLLRAWQFSAWQTMCCTAIWSAALYLPVYFGVIGFSSPNASLAHLAFQGFFHSIVVMIIATITYALAVARLGAFFAGGLASLAPFIAAILAVPLLGEPLSGVMLLGLIGMGLGTVQPWRWLKGVGAKFGK